MRLTCDHAYDSPVVTLLPDTFNLHIFTILKPGLIERQSHFVLDRTDAGSRLGHGAGAYRRLQRRAT